MPAKKPKIALNYRFHSQTRKGDFTPFKVVFDIRTPAEAQAFHDDIACAVTDMSVNGNNALVQQAHLACDGDFSRAPTGTVFIKPFFKS